MKKILYVLFLIGSIALVSLYGGNISYLLFYFALFLPALVLGYSVYVYVRFKIGQEMERTVVKGSKIPYTLMLANEDVLPFTNLALHFYTDKVSVEECRIPEEESCGEQDIDRLCLFPGQRLRLDTKMYCKYRGTYEAGVRSVSVTDFLGLFTITYPVQEPRRVTVLPRILPFERLAAGLRKQDPKNNLFSASKRQSLPDFELRPYRPGDPPKYIHWKNSARAGELLVRKQMPEELTETVVIMDLSPVAGSGEERLQGEDKIVEAAVCFVHHYYQKRLPVKVVFREEEQVELLINSTYGFDAFYNRCPALRFVSGLPVEQVWETCAGRSGREYAFVIITQAVTDGLRRRLEENRRLGWEAVLVDTGELQL